MAAIQMFGTRNLVWPVTNVVTRAGPCECDYSDRRLQKTRKKRNRQTYSLRHLNIVIYYISTEIYSLQTHRIKIVSL